MGKNKSYDSRFLIRKHVHQKYRSHKFSNATTTKQLSIQYLKSSENIFKELQRNQHIFR